ncbi:class A beta-lactamase [Streptomyces yaizuensis]|uniref:Beta-lactamase n=1 Tax=Streptomyces yaizuensis TaxID=2989713 RepID=A0ABQ5P0C0_9ACTN|nr:class A beta-lactamase [Streptomyces sp. YSPA8]GLF96048.1 class A beta-lactamase [Streptomyces sp. YSPA8]
MIRRSNSPRPSRRSLLTAGTALAATTVAAGTAGTARAAGPARAPQREEIPARWREQLSALEQEHSARIGVYGHNPATGRTVVHRADELFPMCSLFKTVAAAAVLRYHDSEFLARRIRYTLDEVVEDSPITKEHVATGMTVVELCAAAVRHSDNTAANLLLRELGGPSAITSFCRSLGDRVTRLDRWEPQLNSSEPGRVEDTTSPRAIGGTYAELVLGGALAGPDLRRLTGWLTSSTTGEKRLRKGLPVDWTLGEKTGASRTYGTNNDAGVAWTPEGTPLVLVVMTTKPGHPHTPDPDHPVVAKTAALLGEALVRRAGRNR